MAPAVSGIIWREQKMITNSVIKVGDGRGFVVEGVDGTRYVITAAHCLPNLPVPHGLSYTEERTYPKLLGRLGEEPSAWAECVFVDPVADIAVLSEPDNQELGEQAEAYGALVEAVTPFTIAEPQGKPIAEEANRILPHLPRDIDWDTAIRKWVMHECPARLLSLDNQWFPCTVQYFPDHALMIKNATLGIMGGMSGSPIIAEDGTAIGIVCLAVGLDDRATEGGPNPRLMNNLPGWLLKKLRTAVPEYVKEFCRWQNAPAAEKDRIAIEVAMQRKQSGPDWAHCDHPLDTVAPNGKLLGDCTGEDLSELAAWEHALAKAEQFLAERGPGPKAL